MAAPIVEIRFNDAEFGPVVIKTTAKKAEKAIQQVSLFIEDSARKKAPKVTENLHQSITTSFRYKGFDTEGTVKATAQYALFVHEGTGIFGPKKRPIFPKNKKALAFMIGGKEIVVKSIKGMRPRPFLKDAFDEEGPKLRKLIFP